MSFFISRKAKIIYFILAVFSIIAGTVVFGVYISKEETAENIATTTEKQVNHYTQKDTGEMTFTTTEKVEGASDIKTNEISSEVKTTQTALKEPDTSESDTRKKVSTENKVTEASTENKPDKKTIEKVTATTERPDTEATECKHDYVHKTDKRIIKDAFCEKKKEYVCNYCNSAFDTGEKCNQHQLNFDAEDIHAVAGYHSKTEYIEHEAVTEVIEYRECTKCGDIKR